MNPDDVVKAKPNFVSSLTLNNNTSINQQMNVTFSKKATESSTFSKTKGISLKVGATVQVGVPILASATVSTDLTNSGSSTYGDNESKEDSQSYSFTAIFPAHRIVVAKAILLYMSLPQTTLLLLGIEVVELLKKFKEDGLGYKLVPRIIN